MPELFHKIFLIILVLSLFSCKKEDEPKPNVYIKDDLSVSKWHLYQYQLNQTTNPIVINDTLYFFSNTSYNYNGQSFEYYLEKGESYNNYRLVLYGTPFGNLAGNPPLDFKNNGNILGISFVQLTTSNAPSYYLWLKKI